MEIESDFGHWLAGFIAGEGCFSITKSGNRHICEFRLSLRDDDGPIIEEIQNRLGIGSVTAINAQGQSKPMVAWIVRRKEETLVLVSILDKFSLRAKKAKDYTIWRRAVFAWAAMDLDRVANLYEELKVARSYEASQPTKLRVA